MIWSPVAAVVRTCVRAVRRATPKPLTGLTMQQASALLAPRPRIVRRAVALGCPAGLAPVISPAPLVARIPSVPAGLEPIPAAPLPLPFGIGEGPLLPPLPPWGAPPAWVPTLPDLPLPSEAVPEPATLALLLAAVALLAVVRRAAS